MSLAKTASMEQSDPRAHRTRNTHRNASSRPPAENNWRRAPLVKHMMFDVEIKRVPHGAPQPWTGTPPYDNIRDDGGASLISTGAKKKKLVGRKNLKSCL